MGTAIFPTGTSTVFQQSAAPQGWVKDTTLNDYTLRIVGTTPASPGGTVDFSAAMVNMTFTGTLGPAANPGSNAFAFDSGETVAGWPPHSHPATIRFFNSVTSATTIQLSGSGLKRIRTNAPVGDTGSQGGGGVHTHFLTGTTSFTGNSKNFAVKYLDVIIATMS